MLLSWYGDGSTDPRGEGRVDTVTEKAGGLRCGSPRCDHLVGYRVIEEDGGGRNGIKWPKGRRTK